MADAAPFVGGGGIYHGGGGGGRGGDEKYMDRGDGNGGGGDDDDNNNDDDRDYDLLADIRPLPPPPPVVEGEQMFGGRRFVTGSRRKRDEDGDDVVTFGALAKQTKLAPVAENAVITQWLRNPATRILFDGLDMREQYFFDDDDEISAAQLLNCNTSLYNRQLEMRTPRSNKPFAILSPPLQVLFCENLVLGNPTHTAGMGQPKFPFATGDKLYRDTPKLTTSNHLDCLDPDSVYQQADTMWQKIANCALALSHSMARDQDLWKDTKLNTIDQIPFAKGVDIPAAIKENLDFKVAMRAERFLRRGKLPIYSMESCEIDGKTCMRPEDQRYCDMLIYEAICTMYSPAWAQYLVAKDKQIRRSQFTDDDWQELRGQIRQTFQHVMWRGPRDKYTCRPRNYSPAQVLQLLQTDHRTDEEKSSGYALHKQPFWEQFPESIKCDMQKKFNVAVMSGHRVNPSLIVEGMGQDECTVTTPMPKHGAIVVVAFQPYIVFDVTSTPRETRLMFHLDPRALRVLST